MKPETASTPAVEFERPRRRTGLTSVEASERSRAVTDLGGPGGSPAIMLADESSPLPSSDEPESLFARAIVRAIEGCGALGLELERY
jgi:hypothetical protein